MSQAVIDPRHSTWSDQPQTGEFRRTAAGRRYRLSFLSCLRVLVLLLAMLLYHVTALCAVTLVAGLLLIAPVLLIFGGIAVIGLVIQVFSWFLGGVGAI